MKPNSGPVEPQPPVIRFTDVTAQSGITFHHFNGATGKKLLPETMGSGVAVLDFDRDGKTDLFFVNSAPWAGDPRPEPRPTQALYRNRGNGTFEDVSAAVGLDLELFGMGVAVGDIDNDGWPDLFVTVVGGNRLFRNIGGKRFEDITAAAGFNRGSGIPSSRPQAVPEGVNAADVAFPSSVTFLDFDGDGRLDLFICNYLSWSPTTDLGIRAVLPGGIRAYVPPQYFAGAECQLWRNVDGMKFTDVSATAGVRVSSVDGAGRKPIAVGKALGVVVCDPDGDGFPDLIVANDTVRNFFFHNVATPGGGRRFEEIGMATGLAYADGRPRGGMGIDAGYLQPDLFAVVVANFSNEPSSLFRQTSINPLQFSDCAQSMGLSGGSRDPMKFGTLFFDYDGDGRLDLFNCNGHLEPDIARAQSGQSYPQRPQLFWNSGRERGLFVLVKAEDIFPAIVGRGCAVLDIDGDGDLDLVVTENNGPARIFRNNTHLRNNWLQLSLVGTGPTTNRDAFGAVVEIHGAGGMQRRYLSPSRGYLSQSDSIVTFGLGQGSVEKVVIRWPGALGKSQEWRDFEVNSMYRLVQGDPAALKAR